MNLYGDDNRVINGIRRGEEFDPLLVRPVEHLGNPAGFELVAPSDTVLFLALSPRQAEHWKKLPPEFAFDDVAGKQVPRSSLSRIIKRAESLGALTKDSATGRYRKVAAKESERGGSRNGTSGSSSNKGGKAPDNEAPPPLFPTRPPFARLWCMAGSWRQS
jgi:hypothetical protein